MNNLESYQKLIEQKNSALQQLAQLIEDDPAVFDEALKNLLSKDNTIRFNNFEAFQLIARNHPEKLYPHWDYFQNLLSSKNTYHKYIGIHIIANLTPYDPENKFEKIVDDFLGLVNDKSIVTVNHAIKALTKIIKHKPGLRQKIIDFLFTVEKLREDAKHKDLTMAYVIETFQESFEFIEEKEAVLNFVKDQINSTSPKTRQAAKNFMESRT